MPPSVRPARLIAPTLAAIVMACCLTSPVRADDCSPVKAGMLATVRTPHTASFMRTKDGKPVTSQMIQTNDARYFEVEGKWRSMPFSAGDVREMEDNLNKSTLTCTRVGNDRLNGKSVTVYTVHLKNEDVESDAKLWVGADGLPLKVDNTMEGENHSSIYDFSHVEAPADATPLGKR
jgi:hypothetical protein